MSRTLIIAEKPSVARAVGAWLSTKLRAPLAVASSRNYLTVGTYEISWLFGHVLENYAPHDYDAGLKKWRMSDLVIAPSVWKLNPKESAAKQIAALKDLLRTATDVIGLGDPDQEGQLLQDEFLLWAGSKLPVRRLWLSALDDASLEAAWASMKPNSHYEGYYWSALARSHADWLTGINLSRACTLASQACGGDAVLTVGRVQTPTLALVVGREKEIRSFKPVDYFTPFINLEATPGFKATWNPDKETDSRLDSEGRLLDRRSAEGIAAACKRAGEAKVIKVTAVNGKKAPPLPFSLASLQTYMARKHGMSVSDTLKTAQSLYEKKIATYPRTDTEFLPESQHADSAAVLPTLVAAAALSAAVAKADLSLKSAAFNDKKVTAHHAIVPRPTTATQLASLTPSERILWEELARRFILQFFPAATYRNTEIELLCAGEAFKATGKVYLNRGWMAAFSLDDEDEEDEASLPALTKGGTLPVIEAGVDATRTKPPKRFTDGTLVAAMKNIYRFVTDPKVRATLRDNVGIGTEATRASIIEELSKRKYFVIEKNFIRPTPLGELLIDSLPRQIASPDMTAHWQQAMDEIRTTGEVGYKKFISAQVEWLRTLVDAAPAWFKGKPPAQGNKSSARTSTRAKPTAHKCPLCKGELAYINGNWGWFFACQQPDCKATFKDVEGKPVAKATKVPGETLKIGEISSGDACPKCGKGTLQVRTCGPTSKVPGAKFLSCSQYFAKGADKCSHSIWPAR